MADGMTSRTHTDDWEHALIVGNGRQGALFYGGPSALRITLSHERLFLPLNPPLDAPPTVEILDELRALLLDGHYQAAADRVAGFAAEYDAGYADVRWIDPLVGAGTLTFTPAGQRGGTDYRRATDYRAGVATQRWRTPGGEVRAELFVSRPDDVVVCRISGCPDGVLRLDPVARPPHHLVHFQTQANAAGLALRGRFPAAWPETIHGYGTACRIVAVRGTVREVDGELRVTGADEVVLLARTEVDAPTERLRADLEALPADVDALLAAHTEAHAVLFDRCSLRMADTDTDGDVEDLLAEPGPALMEHLFAAGRYAIISSTGGLPPTLQGVWSGTWHPPWSSGFTLDGNLEAAVAALCSTRTPELLLPVFDLAEALLPDFRANARRLYGAAGILVPAHVSTHGRHNHFGPVWCLTFWTAGAAWLSRLYHDYWRYTGDRTFLAERAWPFMTEAADFYTDFVLPWGDGYAFAPSYSPENAPSSTGSQAAVNATMDVAAVADLLRNLLDAADVLDRKDPREARWHELLAGLPPYRINENGELAEWIWPGLDDEHAHRHSSHHYPLWYELDPAFADPALRAAAVRSVEARLAWWRGAESDEMSFGLTQLGLAAAQLGLAEAAHETLTMLARSYWRPNLVSTHNRRSLFNVDICGGLPAVIAAMLVRSRRDGIDLLPALPGAWPRGEIRGLAARYGITVERLAWTPDRVEADIEAPGEITIGVPAGRTIAIVLRNGHWIARHISAP